MRHDRGVAGTSRTTRSVTMADVARLAGVSVATVSRALSGTRAVDPEMRERVQHAATQLGYRVNLVGRALRQSRSSTVGLIVPDFENPFFTTLAHHLARAFTGSDTDLLVFSADGSTEAEARGVRSFLGRQVDALVLIPVHEEGSAEAMLLASSTVHTVQLDRRVPGTSSSYVGVSNRQGMALVQRHIDTAVDTDRQPVVYVGAKATSSSAHERLDAARQWLGRGAPTLLGEFSAAWGRDAAAQLLAEGWTSGTVVAAADIIAVGVIDHLLEHGRSVPHDFRVIGFDGAGILAHPTLTTVRQPVEAMALAIRTVIEEDGPPTQQWFEPTLVLGQTSPERQV